MCRRIECATCGRPSFAGCGAHIEQVLSDVPPGQRCQCRATGKAASSTGGSLWTRLFGKG